MPRGEPFAIRTGTAGGNRMLSRRPSIAVYARGVFPRNPVLISPETERPRVRAGTLLPWMNARCDPSGAGAKSTPLFGERDR
jgi:hypothetical protein